MSRPDHETEVTLEDRIFKIVKFTPETGSYWACRLFGDMAGAIAGTGNFTKDQLPGLITSFMKMEKKEFKAFQNDCLTSVLAKLEAGYRPLMNSEGFLILPDLSGQTVFALTVQSFLFSISGFFDQSFLGNLMGGLSQVMAGILPQEQSGSESSSIPPSA